MSAEDLDDEIFTPRSFDGVGNNEAFPAWGAVGTTLVGVRSGTRSVMASTMTTTTTTAATAVLTCIPFPGRPSRPLTMNRIKENSDFLNHPNQHKYTFARLLPVWLSAGWREIGRAQDKTARMQYKRC